MTKRSTIVIALVALGGLIFVGASWSQQPGAAPVPRVPQGPNFIFSADPVNIAGERPADAYPIGRKNKKSESANTARKIARLMSQLGEADEQQRPLVVQSGSSSTSVTTTTVEKTDQSKKKAELTHQLEAAVAEGFDVDMKVREGELSKLEERLGKLRAQLDRRRKAKSEIIQLEVKVLVNEAAGLGFSGGAPAAIGGRFDMGSFRRRSKPSATEPSEYQSEVESR